MELSTYDFSTLRGGTFTLSRGLARGLGNGVVPILLVAPAGDYPSPESLQRLEHEFALRTELDADWAALPVELLRRDLRQMLVLEDHGGEPLERLLGEPLDVAAFLRIAVPLAAAVGQMHARGLIHKDIKPANILVDTAAGAVWLTGFGIASRLPRERQASTPPAVIAGTLAYMAPEQTGRMNRSIDTRSDLYSLGVSFYEMLTGTLPFTASDPMEWVHAHIARQPVPPAERSPNIPAAVSAIVLKLLAKTAEERYQTAGGVERDLRRCLAEWESQRRIDAFTLGARDTPDRLLIPEKLYGRGREVETLLAAFDRVVTSGTPELVLVSGYSGIGKSSVVNELHNALVPTRGLFASGKFDQYRRDIPYATLTQAFQGLIRPLLAKSDAELAGWRDAFREALGPNGRLIVDLVPELKLIIGDQLPVPELPPRDAQRRFQLVLRRFIDVFARPDHPLALFLDDLQWLDAATLDLLEALLTQPDVQHLLLIGAYRDNEVDVAHPLMRKLAAIRGAGAILHEITLVPLARRDLAELIANALQCEPERVVPLAGLVHDKTAGNPFFAIQFLSALADEELLTFDHGAACWSWDLDRIHAKGYTDNVVDLMVGKLTRLPTETGRALQQLACLGNIADVATLSLVLETSAEEVDSDLWDALRLELIERLDGSYKFVHDRVQEGAYSLIRADARAEAHLRIGRLLVARTPPEKREEAIFEIVNQLNRAVALITARDEREQVAELNLIAGKRAKDSTAYASALTYLTAGAALLAEDSWERRHELVFPLELNRAECEFLTGALAEAEQRLTELSARAATTVERASVTCLRVDLYMTLGQGGRAVAVGLDYLRHLGIEWSPHPTDDDAHREYQRIWSIVGHRTIDELVALPLMRDAASLATLDVLNSIQSAAYFTSINLHALVTCLAVDLSLQFGNSDGSCAHYATFGLNAGPRLGEYEAGYRFGRLATELIEQRGLRRFQARTYVTVAHDILPWTRHVRVAREPARRASEAANNVGDLTIVAYCCYALNSNLLTAGDPLDEVQAEAERGLAFVRKLQFGFVADLITPQLGLIRTLRGSTPKFGCFDDEQFDELEMEHRFSSIPDLAYAEGLYWIRKLQARFLAGDYAAALDASSRAQPLLWKWASRFETAEYHFYDALSHAASWDSAAADQRQGHVEPLVAHHQQLQIWAARCPENFENCAALVGAEIARMEGRALDAMELYEQAIRSARANGFVHNEGIANEMAARFYGARGFEQIAQLYLRNARRNYRSWGAEGKVRQLDHLYPHLDSHEPALDPRPTIGAPVEQLDLATVLKVSHAVSGDIVPEKLVETLLRTALEHAGAERGLLILPYGGDFRIEAEATTAGGMVAVHLRPAPTTASELPESIVQYAARTQESVVLDDASARNPFSTDEYIRERRARSVLCLPLVKQGRLVALLYLENHLTPHAFTADRVSVLELLASQAAFSLENARLYDDLRRSEASLLEAQQISRTGSWRWDVGTGEVQSSTEHTRIYGFDPATPPDSYAAFVDRIPADDRAALEHELARAVRERSRFQVEFRIMLPDGSVRHAQTLGHPDITESGDLEYVGTLIDVTERRRAEEALRTAQAELARVARLTTMGELAASFAHEINQPLAAIAANGEAGMRWLNRETPDLGEARDALSSIARDAARAGEVIRGLRALASKSGPPRTTLDIDHVIREVLALTRSEMQRHGAVLRTDLAAGDQPVVGDQVQLQQVLLNLILNGLDAMSAVTDRPRELAVSSTLAEPGSVVVVVDDTGAGLDPAIAQRIFEPFFTTKADGLGMGLSICRSIIEAHGGRLWMSPRTPHGTAFHFTVPIGVAT